MVYSHSLFLRSGVMKKTQVIILFVDIFIAILYNSSQWVTNDSKAINISGLVPGHCCNDTI